MIVWRCPNCNGPMERLFFIDVWSCPGCGISTDGVGLPDTKVVWISSKRSYVQVKQPETAEEYWEQINLRTGELDKIQDRLHELTEALINDPALKIEPSPTLWERFKAWCKWVSEA